MEQYVKGFQRFHAREDVQPVTSCKFLLYYYYYYYNYYYYYYYCRCCCCRSWTLITGFTCPPTIYFKFITKCDKCYYRVRQLFLSQSAMLCFYKVRQLFYYKVRKVLLQSATGITKCDNFITKCDSYYKVRRYCMILV